jgi:hypothetical protein
VPSPVPSELARPPRLIGREREWALMERAWGASQAVILSGAPGVGKTRLLEDFLAAYGGVRFEGRPGDTLHPYSTHARTYRQLLERFELSLEDWVRAELARILPELGDAAPPMGSDADRLRFVQAKARVTRQAVSLGMRAVAVDDLQFVDDASLEAGYAVYSEHWGHADGMRTIMAYREGELSSRAQSMLEATVNAGLGVHVRLEPLSDHAGFEGAQPAHRRWQPVVRARGRPRRRDRRCDSQARRRSHAGAFGATLERRATLGAGRGGRG